MSCKLKDYDYYLPKELIAQYPLKERDSSRLMLIHRDSGDISHHQFKDLPKFLKRKDVLVLNDTKVMPYRLFGRKVPTGAELDVLLLSKEGQDRFWALVNPAKRAKAGSRIIFANDKLVADVEKEDREKRLLSFNTTKGLDSLLNKFGNAPLPPYIKRKPQESDRYTYQTVYAKKDGAIAAPTAELHFTKKLLEKISNEGVEIEYITLHVGYGTFKPVGVEDLKTHEMEAEYFEIPQDVAERLNIAKKRQGCILAIGTTTCRALESAAEAIDDDNFSLVGKSGWTDLFIYPPYRFKYVDMLLTNFHLPKTTLYMLVSAFAGKELIQKAYREAIRAKYRFYSYGDATLIV